MKGITGKHLKIKIGNVSLVYAHCNELYVNEGDKIVQGQEIAEVGSTGNSTGPHLHFEIRLNEETIDPESILEL
ncbi:MAG: M23 family metallopeptidase [Clostridia bacterium]|nr:M23 family metallopeptidase [Clostridia bacterium]